MKVRLIKTWFAPTDKRMKFPVIDPGTGAHKYMMSLSGQRFRPGVHEFPDAWAELLPKTAIEILDPAYVAPEPVEIEQTLKDHDIERAAGEAEEKVHQEVNDSLAKARAAKAAKAKARKAAASSE